MLNLKNKLRFWMVGIGLLLPVSSSYGKFAYENWEDFLVEHFCTLATEGLSLPFQNPFANLLKACTSNNFSEKKWQFLMETLRYGVAESYGVKDSDALEQIITCLTQVYHQDTDVGKLSYQKQLQDIFINFYKVYSPNGEQKKQIANIFNVLVFYLILAEMGQDDFNFFVNKFIQKNYINIFDFNKKVLLLHVGYIGTSPLCICNTYYLLPETRMRIMDIIRCLSERYARWNIEIFKNSMLKELIGFLSTYSPKNKEARRSQEQTFLEHTKDFQVIILSESGQSNESAVSKTKECDLLPTVQQWAQDDLITGFARILLGITPEMSECLMNKLFELKHVCKGPTDIQSIREKTTSILANTLAKRNRINQKISDLKTAKDYLLWKKKKQGSLSSEDGLKLEEILKEIDDLTDKRYFQSKEIAPLEYLEEVLGFVQENIHVRISETAIKTLQSLLNKKIPILYQERPVVEYKDDDSCVFRWLSTKIQCHTNHFTLIQGAIIGTDIDIEDNFVRDDSGHFYKLSSDVNPSYIKARKYTHFTSFRIEENGVCVHPSPDGNLLVPIYRKATEALFPLLERVLNSIYVPIFWHLFIDKILSLNSKHLELCMKVLQKLNKKVFKNDEHREILFQCFVKWLLLKDLLAKLVLDLNPETEEYNKLNDIFKMIVNKDGSGTEKSNKLISTFADLLKNILSPKGACKEFEDDCVGFIQTLKGHFIYYFADDRKPVFLNQKDRQTYTNLQILEQILSKIQTECPYFIKVIIGVMQNIDPDDVSIDNSITNMIYTLIAPYMKDAFIRQITFDVKNLSYLEEE